MESTSVSTDPLCPPPPVVSGDEDERTNAPPRVRFTSEAPIIPSSPQQSTHDEDDDGPGTDSGSRAIERMKQRLNSLYPNLNTYLIRVFCVVSVAIAFQYAYTFSPSLSLDMRTKDQASSTQLPVVLGALRHVTLPNAKPTMLPFLYCSHMRSTNASRTWLAQQKLLVKEKEKKLSARDQIWRDRSCVTPFKWKTHHHTSSSSDDNFIVHKFDGTFDRYIAAAPLLNSSARVENFTRRYHPRVKSVIIDDEQELYYPVTMHDGRGGLSQVIISHNNLCATLDEWALQYRNASAGLNLHGLPCICPIDFGIVGSGMFFSTDDVFLPDPNKVRHDAAELPCQFRILIDVDVHHRSGTNGNSMSVEFPQRIHHFPNAVEKHLYPRGRPLSYPDWIFFSGHDVTPLFSHEKVREIEGRALLISYMSSPKDKDDAKGIDGNPITRNRLHDDAIMGPEDNDDDDGDDENGIVGDGSEYLLFTEGYTGYGHAIGANDYARFRIIDQNKATGDANRCYARCMAMEEGAKGAYTKAGKLPDPEPESSVRSSTSPTDTPTTSIRPEDAIKDGGGGGGKDKPMEERRNRRNRAKGGRH